MQTRSKSDADATSRLRTRRQHAKNNQRIDDDAHTPVKSSCATSVAPSPPRRFRSSSLTPTQFRRDSHDSVGGRRPNSTRHIHATKSSSHHRSPSPRRNSGGDDDEDDGGIGRTGSPPTESPRRQSVRRAVLDKQPKPTTIFRHHLFLEPTLARQAKKRRQKERERVSEKKNEGNDHSSETGQELSHHHEESDNEDISLSLLQTNGKNKAGSRHTQNTTNQSFGPSRKRTWEVAGLKQREDSPLPCAAKVPRRKMSAVAPGPDRSFKVATFRRSRDEELPEGAKELIAQADMARQKKKKPKTWPKGHNDHSPCHFLETELSQSSTHPIRDDETFPLGLSSTKSKHARGAKTQGKQQTPLDGSSPTSNNSSMDKRRPQNSSDRVGDIILRRRQYAIDFLASAHDISSIYAGIVVINDLYNGDDFPPSVTPVVIQAQAMGIILLTESLTSLLAKQTQDGVNVSCLGARLLVKRLIDHLTIILMDDMSLHPEKMMGSGLTTSEVAVVSPMLRGVLDEIRQMFLSLSEEVLAMGGDQSAS